MMKILLILNVVTKKQKIETKTTLKEIFLNKKYVGFVERLERFSRHDDYTVK